MRYLRLKILDRYIIGKFLGTYVFAIVLILAITIMFDVNEKLDSFLKAPLKATIFEYFLNFLPYFANQFSPLFTFIAVIFFTSKLADNSEIIAILSSGMSCRRRLGRRPRPQHTASGQRRRHCLYQPVRQQQQHRLPLFT